MFKIQLFGPSGEGGSAFPFKESRSGPLGLFYAAKTSTGKKKQQRFQTRMAGLGAKRHTAERPTEALVMLHASLRSLFICIHYNLVMQLI